MSMALAIPQTRARPVGSAVAVLAIATVTIAGAFLFQAAGYAPCELCLKERLPYYAGMAVAAALIPIAWRGPRAATVACFGLLAAIFLFSAGFGAYHAGVEWGAWPGPTDCTGTLTQARNNADFLRQLQNVKVVRCDAVAVRVLGLSLAGWNALVSVIAAATAMIGLRWTSRRATAASR